MDNYYIFTNYKDLSSHIHDVVHFARPKLGDNSHSFSVMTGEVYWDKMVFVNDNGDNMPLKHEQEYNLYYCTLPGDDYSIELSTADRS